MSKNQNLNKHENEFDLFFALYKNWKTILIVSFIFVFLGIAYLLITPRTYTARSYFTVSIGDSISTIFGSYKFKTQDPMDYLSIFEFDEFSESILYNLDLSNSNKVSFDIDAEKVNVPPNSNKVIYPKKFDLTIKGKDKEQIIEIANQSIDVFLERTDTKVHKNMIKNFTSELKSDIESHTFNIKVQKNLVERIESIINHPNPENTGKVNISSLEESRVLNNLDDNERSLIISMLLNEKQGTTYYKNAVLMIKMLELNELENKLEKKKMLLEKLNKSVENNNYKELIKNPFSRNFIMLNAPEIVVENIKLQYLRKLLIFLFLGAILTSTVVVIRYYIALKYK